jgi:hypothetical protein
MQCYYESLDYLYTFFFLHWDRLSEELEERKATLFFFLFRIIFDNSAHKLRKQ